MGSSGNDRKPVIDTSHRLWSPHGIDLLLDDNLQFRDGISTPTGDSLGIHDLHIIACSLVNIK